MTRTYLIDTICVKKPESYDVDLYLKKVSMSFSEINLLVYQMRHLLTQLYQCIDATKVDTRGSCAENIIHNM